MGQISTTLRNHAGTPGAVVFCSSFWSFDKVLCGDTVQGAFESFFSWSQHGGVAGDFWIAPNPSAQERSRSILRCTATPPSETATIASKTVERCEPHQSAVKGGDSEPSCKSPCPHQCKMCKMQHLFLHFQGQSRSNEGACLYLAKRPEDIILPAAWQNSLAPQIWLTLSPQLLNLNAVLPPSN